MSKWNDFINDEPPAGHAERIMKAANPELNKLAIENRRTFLNRFLFSWQGLSLGSAFSVVAGALWFLSLKQSRPNKGELEMADFQEIIDSESAEDIEFLVLEDIDLEFFDSLELLEEMEDV